MPKGKPWIGVDLDCTLAEYTGWEGMLQIGPPILRMVRQCKVAMEKGYQIKVFTARAAGLYSDNYNERIQAEGIVKAIKRWTVDVFGYELEVTAVKDMDMVELWDDRAREVLPNKGYFLRELMKDSNGQRCFV